MSRAKSALAFILACAAGVGAANLSHLGRKSRTSLTNKEAVAKVNKRVRWSARSGWRHDVGGTVLFVKPSLLADGYDVAIQWDDDFDGKLLPSRLVWFDKENFARCVDEE
ncbi:MAG: hypothetical protein M3444_04920 [Acidobacteriota bacterium]|nr:hypothetical protein [Acidobacteriota bacterium]MDQ5836154.1 hypothetical protein [Acidobacteriota bacterium]